MGKYTVTSREVKELRSITEEGILRCKEALQKTGSIEKAIGYLRQHSEEPHIIGISEERYDVLDRDGKVIQSYNNDKELRNNLSNLCKNRIRYVSKLGYYSYLK